MKTPTVIPFLLTIAAGHLLAGNLNVINLSDASPLGLILSAKDGNKALTVESKTSSGPFKLGDDPVVLKTLANEPSDLEIPASQDPRIAILYPAGETAKWKLLPSKATEEKWSLRVVNLMGVPVVFSYSGNEISLENDREIEIKVADKRSVGLSLSAGGFQAYPHREPCAVIAFLTKEGDKTIVTFVPDI